MLKKIITLFFVWMNLAGLSQGAGISVFYAKPFFTPLLNSKDNSSSTSGYYYESSYRDVLKINCEEFGSEIHYAFNHLSFFLGYSDFRHYVTTRRSRTKGYSDPHEYQYPSLGRSENYTTIQEYYQKYRIVKMGLNVELVGVKTKHGTLSMLTGIESLFFILNKSEVLFQENTKTSNYETIDPITQTTYWTSRELSQDNVKTSETIPYLPKINNLLLGVSYTFKNRIQMKWMMNAPYTFPKLIVRRNESREKAAWRGPCYGSFHLVFYPFKQK